MAARRGVLDPMRRRCPACGHVSTGVIPPPGGPAVAGVGALCVCGNCGSFLIVSRTLAFRLLTAAEVGAMPTAIRAELHNAKQLLEYAAALHAGGDTRKQKPC